MIQLPPSKSIGARFLVATYFTRTLPADPVFDENEDLMLLQQALLEVYSDEEPIDYGESQIDVGSSGTALRFVTAVCASSPSADYVITGTQHLMERPMQPLIKILKEAGAGVECFGENDTGPFKITGKRLSGGEFAIEGHISSQFISALMLVAPTWEKGMKLNFSTPLVSRPYLRMTAEIMNRFGVDVTLSDLGVEVTPQRYKEPVKFEVEADWSSAAFFYEACALGVDGIKISEILPPLESLQGDSAADTLFGRLGVSSSYDKEGVTLNCKATTQDRIEIDAGDYPDLVLPLAVACLCRGIKFQFNGIAHLINTQSDRISALQTEADKLGFKITAAPGQISWLGEIKAGEPDPVIDPHADHRVAMAFAMTALKLGEIKVRNPEVVEKSFIDFWNCLPQIGLECSQSGDLMTVRKI